MVIVTVVFFLVFFNAEHFFEVSDRFESILDLIAGLLGIAIAIWAFHREEFKPRIGYLNRTVDYLDALWRKIHIAVFSKYCKTRAISIRLSRYSSPTLAYPNAYVAPCAQTPCQHHLHLL